MKTAVVLVALFALALSAPQPRKLFHEHFEDFLDIIEEEVGDEVFDLISHYFEYEEFRASVDFTRSSEFRDMVAEVESLQEFKDIIEFLESDNIDIFYFLDRFHEMLDYGRKRSTASRHSHDDDEAHDMTAFIRDCTKLFPEDKLAELYEQKMADDEEFRNTMANLESEEWEKIYGALWENEVFLEKVETLRDNGIEVAAVVDEILAVFGKFA